MAFVAPVLGFMPKYHNSFIHSFIPFSVFGLWYFFSLFSSSLFSSLVFFSFFSSLCFSCSFFFSSSFLASFGSSSVLPFPSAVSAPPPPSSAPSSFVSFSSSHPSAPSLSLSAPPLGSLAPSSSSFPVVSAPASPAPGSCWLSSVPLPSAPAPSSGVSSSPSASSMDDFAAVQARVLGLSAEYQAVACWFYASGGVWRSVVRLLSTLLCFLSLSGVSSRRIMWV